MNLIQAIILGLIQGWQEFLPVSSSGHLALAQHFFGMNPDSVLPFAVLLHIGTLISVCIVYWRDILGLIYEFFASIKDHLLQPEALTSTRTPLEECAGL